MHVSSNLLGLLYLPTFWSSILGFGMDHGYTVEKWQGHSCELSLSCAFTVEGWTGPQHSTVHTVCAINLHNGRMDRIITVYTPCHNLHNGRMDRITTVYSPCHEPAQWENGQDHYRQCTVHAMNLHTGRMDRITTVYSPCHEPAHWENGQDHYSTQPLPWTCTLGEWTGSLQCTVLAMNLHIGRMDRITTVYSPCHEPAHWENGQDHYSVHSWPWTCTLGEWTGSLQCTVLAMNLHTGRMDRITTVYSPCHEPAYWENGQDHYSVHSLPWTCTVGEWTGSLLCTVLAMNLHTGRMDRITTDSVQSLPWTCTLGEGTGSLQYTALAMNLHTGRMDRITTVHSPCHEPAHWENGQDHYSTQPLPWTCTMGEGTGSLQCTVLAMNLHTGRMDRITTVYSPCNEPAQWKNGQGHCSVQSLLCGYTVK